VSVTQRQQLLRKVCAALSAAGQTHAPAKVNAILILGYTNGVVQIMLALLDTYSADATTPPPDALNDAHASVCTAIADPNVNHLSGFFSHFCLVQVFVMDHLLRLKPVQMLQTKDAALWSLLQVCFQFFR
jgi:hypothetical protein